MPRDFVVPYGVQQAETKTAANLDILVSFTAAAAEIGTVVKAAKALETDGQPCELAWIRDGKGLISGIAIRGERRVA